jgi:CHASE2 domain
VSIEDIADHELPRLEKLIEERKSGLLSGLSSSKPALLVIAILVFLFQIRSLPEKLAGQSLDSSIAAQQHMEARSVRLVAIDDGDYSNLFSATSPLNPEVFSKLLQAIAAGHPRAIIVDIDTSAPSFASMEVPSIPTVWTADGQESKGGKFAMGRPLGGHEIAGGSIAALALVPNDERGIVRSYRRIYELEGGGIAESPGYAMVRLLDPTPTANSMAGTQNERFLDFRYHFSPNRASNVLLNSEAESWKDISLLNATPNSICPLCGQGRVGALDHYLPQSAYPDYVVLPANLVPACTDCNQAKRAWFAKSADDQILHPYFDDFSGDQWLHAKVIPGQSPAVKFYADGPAHWSPVDRARVESHFRVFKLARLFTTHAGSELGSIRSHLVQELKGDTGRIKDHLLEQANSRRAAFLNSWQTAMYVALSTDAWFLSSGFAKIPMPG